MLTHSRANVDVRVIHVGDRADRDFRPFPAIPVVVSEFTRTDVSAVVPVTRFAREGAGVDLTLRVENLFDRKYESTFNFLTPRRTVLAGARATF